MAGALCKAKALANAQGGGPAIDGLRYSGEEGDRRAEEGAAGMGSPHDRAARAWATRARSTVARMADVAASKWVRARAGKRIGPF